ncbi:sugar transferase, PEP-CTERM/EpsH1 system associated [Chromobacterium violaceum]|uniref:Sugar transferase, PEP-CTERM/EpsH1 system associated n=1 Tax=Chromobacterium violaceum TaxID=536 RepID=A0A3S5DLR1_CHRVL|nr:sugar transferase, PEP-CTERM/EpsH1 system associated [Chromobacterium violaceum]
MSVDSPDGLKLLWTLPYLPWPTTSGGKLRQYHLLKELALRGHRITLLVQSKEPPSAECRRELEKLVDRLIVLPRRPLRHPWTLLLAALAPHPLLASVNGFAPALRKRFAELLREEWDAVQIEHSYGLQPFLAELRKRRQPFLLTEHNVESSLAAATYQHLPDWLTPFIHWDRWRYRRWERRALAAPAIVAAVTLTDAAELARRGGRQVEVVVNGVDCMAFAGVRPPMTASGCCSSAISSTRPIATRWPGWSRTSCRGYGAACRRPVWRYAAMRCRSPGLGAGRPQAGMARLRAGAGAGAAAVGGFHRAVAGRRRLQAEGAGGDGGGTAGACHAARRIGAGGQAGRGFLPGLRRWRPGRGRRLAVVPAAARGRGGEAGRAYVRAHHDWRVAAAQLEGQYRRLSHADRH